MKTIHNFLINSSMKRFSLKSVAAVFAGIVTLEACQKNEENNHGGSDNLELKGYVTSDLTLESGKTYKLLGSLQVKAPATLTINKGVTVIAEDNGEINYILIEQGAKINAVGTKDEPIVLTAERKEAGAWSTFAERLTVTLVPAIHQKLAMLYMVVM